MEEEFHSDSECKLVEGGGKGGRQWRGKGAKGGGTEERKVYAEA